MKLRLNFTRILYSSFGATVSGEIELSDAAGLVEITELELVL